MTVIVFGLLNRSFVFTYLLAYLCSRILATHLLFPRRLRRLVLGPLQHLATNVSHWSSELRQNVCACHVFYDSRVLMLMRQTVAYTVKRLKVRKARSKYRMTVAQPSDLLNMLTVGVSGYIGLREYNS